MLNEQANQKAEALGKQLHDLREQYNLTLSQVSSTLEIRSVLLNDMEKGRFSHLNRWDCMAYAKYLGMNLKEVEAVLNEVKVVDIAPNTSTSNKLKVIGAITCVIVVGVVLICAFSASSNNDQATSLSEIKQEDVLNDNVLESEQVIDKEFVQEVQAQEQIASEDKKIEISEEIKEEVTLSNNQVAEQEQNNEVLLTQENEIVSDPLVNASEQENLNIKSTDVVLKENVKDTEQTVANSENVATAEVKVDKDTQKEVINQDKKVSESVVSKTSTLPTQKDVKKKVTSQTSPSSIKQNRTTTKQQAIAKKTNKKVVTNKYKPLKAGEIRSLSLEMPKQSSTTVKKVNNANKVLEDVKSNSSKKIQPLNTKEQDSKIKVLN